MWTWKKAVWLANGSTQAQPGRIPSLQLLSDSDPEPKKLEKLVMRHKTKNILDLAVIPGTNVNK